MVIRSRFIVPIDAPPIENGALAFNDGRITAIGPAVRVGGGPILDFGDAVILPGFVNAHTHLELSLLAGIVPPSSDFTDWLRRLFTARRERLSGEDDIRCSVRVGVDDSLRAGVTTVGDITATPSWTREVLASSPIRAVSFGEVIAIGVLRGSLPRRLDAACHPEFAGDRMRIAVSPHAPYTVEPDGFRACARKADEIGISLCIHLAETRAEDAFTRDGAGPLAEHLRNLDIWDEDIPISGCSPVELTERTGLLSKRTLLAHANYVTDAEIFAIARSGASVAYCPRTHDAFGHEPHRFPDMLRAGINVCVGTDSLASNPNLSVLDELRFFHLRCPDLPPEKLLDLGTLCGARALGLERDIGSLTVGKFADLTVWPCREAGERARWQSILESSSSPLAVYVGGEVIGDSAARTA